MASRILYIVHNPAWTDCRVADEARARGFAVDCVCPAFGDGLPAIEGHAALIVGGSAEGHADRPDEHRWVADEMAYIRAAVDRGVPTLGICMGSQLLAAAFGGKVWARPDGLCELGFFRVDPIGEGRELFAGASHFYEAHFEGVFRLPDEAVLLARSDRYPVQAFRIGERAYGVQFHPDTKLSALTRKFLENDSYRDMFGAQSVDEQLRLAPVYEASIQAWTERFVDRWIGRAGVAAEAA